MTDETVSNVRHLKLASTNEQADQVDVVESPGSYAEMRGMLDEVKNILEKDSVKMVLVQMLTEGGEVITTEIWREGTLFQAVGLMEAAKMYLLDRSRQD